MQMDCGSSILMWFPKKAECNGHLGPAGSRRNRIFTVQHGDMKEESKSDTILTLGTFADIWNKVFFFGLSHMK